MKKLVLVLSLMFSSISLLNATSFKIQEFAGERDCMIYASDVAMRLYTVGTDDYNNTYTKLYKGCMRLAQQQ